MNNLSLKTTKELALTTQDVVPERFLFQLSRRHKAQRDAYKPTEQIPV
jgi:hypothetical protein